MSGKNLSALATALALLIVVQIAAVILMIWAPGDDGDEELALVTGGPYRYWRHPI